MSSGKTSEGGTGSPSVRSSLCNTSLRCEGLAAARRRNDGVSGVLIAVLAAELLLARLCARIKASGAIPMRAAFVSGCGKVVSPSCAKAVSLSGVGTSTLRLRLATKLRDSGRLAVDDKEDSDEVEQFASAFCNKGTSKREPCLRDFFDLCDVSLWAGDGLRVRPTAKDFGPIGRVTRSDVLASDSLRIGVVPSTRPSFRVVCISRARWNGSRVLQEGGTLRYGTVVEVMSVADMVRGNEDKWTGAGPVYEWTGRRSVQGRQLGNKEMMVGMRLADLFYVFPRGHG